MNKTDLIGIVAEKAELSKKDLKEGCRKGSNCIIRCYR